MHLHILFFFFSILLTSLSLSSSQLHNNYHYNYNNQRPPNPEESIELTPPLATSDLPHPPPECSVSLLRHSFGQTVGRPLVTVPYSPPFACPGGWSHVVLHLSGSVSGNQAHRVTGVWLAGAELLRSSTPEPFNSGTFWNVQKDITRYSSLLQRSNVYVSMMLENLVNDEFDGVYHVNLTILFYKHDKVELKSDCLGYQSALRLGANYGYGGVVSYEHPADFVIPIVADIEGNGGFWFRIEDETRLVSKSIIIPRNTQRLVLEMYASFHGDDEFWYSNPPNRYCIANNLTTNQANGPFRELYVRVDGNYVGSEIPFPIVFPGGINPLFWKPVVAIGAFDMPSYHFDLTPFLGFISDGKMHKYELGVAHANKFWLIDANLHVWVERETSNVEARLGIYQPPIFQESSKYNFKRLDGRFQSQAQRRSVSAGWVSVSCGNLTTIIARRMRFKNNIMFQNNGTVKTVKQQVKVRTAMSVFSDKGEVIAQKKFKGASGLTLITSIVPGPKNDSTLITTNLTIVLKEQSNDGNSKNSFKNSQISGGWMVVLQNQTIVSGKADTQQILNYRGNSGCFVRTVGATGGRLQSDFSTTICPSFFRKAVNKVLNLFVGYW